MTLLDDFRRHLVTLHLPPGRALVAVSGGPDSVALLDLLFHTLDDHRLDLVVAHFDHGIHPASARVAAGVRALADAYHLAYEEGHGALGPDAGETVARHARYAWLEATRADLGATLIITAHHADDQVETVLMRALAGSGPAGLAGMAARGAALVRPLLPFRREAVVRYVRMAGLPAWTDPANHDARHLRAWLRADLLPTLRDRLPKVDEALLSVGRHAARERAAWSAALTLLPGLDFRPEREGFSVAARVLSGYDSALGATLLMAAGRRVGCRLGPGRADRVLGIAARAASGSTVPLGQGWMAEIAFGRVVVGRVEGASSPTAWTVEGGEGVGQWGRWRLRWLCEAAPARQERRSLSAWISPAPLTVRGWIAGDRIRPIGGPGHRLLVRCFQDARVQRSRRGQWPVVAGGEEVVWVPGVCRSDALLPAPGTEAVRIDAEYA
ncbi:MAG: tRNA lysidine(34) synthetase TilS [Gemmatimonadales bacterium]